MVSDLFGLSQFSVFNQMFSFYFSYFKCKEALNICFHSSLDTIRWARDSFETEIE